jgi:hypothetical protein
MGHEYTTRSFIICTLASFCTVIKYRIRLAAHEECVGGTGSLYAILVEKPGGKDCLEGLGLNGRAT